MKNKKSVMAVSAIMVIIFHLWATVTPTTLPPLRSLEMFLKFLCFAGVDMFFFCSAFSLADRRIDHIRSFYASRFRYVYLKYLVFILLGALVGRWSILRCLGIASGVELIQKGGGSFLWFVPVIMAVYIIAPWYQKVRDKTPYTGAAVLILWLTVALLTARSGRNTLAIVWNRIPVMVAGYEFGKNKLFEKFRGKKAFIAASWALAASGAFFVYLTGYKSIVSKPIADCFYVAALPLTVGLVALLENTRSVPLLRAVGSCTLEMYGLQMVFGFRLASYILKYLLSLHMNKVLTFTVSNLLSISIVTAASIALERAFTFVLKAVSRWFAKNN